MCKSPNSSEPTPLQKMIASIESGLKDHSADELAEAIENYLSKKQLKNDEVNFLLNLISKDYNIPTRQLKGGRLRGEHAVAKRQFICILHFKLQLSQRHIAKKILDNTHKVVGEVCRYFLKLDMKFIQDKEFKDKYELYCLKLTEFMEQKFKPSPSIN